jgi:ABC-2 type transport system ATP-binding protein
MEGPCETLTLSAENLGRCYGKLQAVEGLNLELRRGEVLGFLGPNGAGKSTTMQMLSGCLAPSQGRVTIMGQDLAQAPRQAKRHLGYLPEPPPLYAELTVDEYLGFAARLHGLNQRMAMRATEEAKLRCGLAEVGKRLIHHLSRGYRQRLGIAQAILHQPDVVILDEPTAGLDPNQTREVRELVRHIARNAGVIFCTHILPEVESLCDRVLVLNRGRVVHEGAATGLEELFSRLDREDKA